MSQYQRIIVIGTGAVANNCALCVKNAGETVELIESRLSPMTTCRKFCEKHSIIYQLLLGKELGDYLSKITEITLVVSAANRYLFPKEIINKKNFTIINYHGALLPKHPGRNAEAWAIYEGDKEAGITWHFVVPNVDAGNILIQKPISITKDTTSFTLLRTNSKLAVDAFEEILPRLLNGTIVGYEQTKRNNIHYSWMKPNEGVLDLTWDSTQIDAFLRAMDYGPLQTMGIPAVAVGDKTYYIQSYKKIEKTDNDLVVPNVIKVTEIGEGMARLTVHAEKACFELQLIQQDLLENKE